MIIARRFVLSIFLLGFAAGCSGGDEDGDDLGSNSKNLEAPEDVGGIPDDPEVEVEESGLASRVLVAGTGTQHPTEADTVRVHYVGWQTDGHKFDSSYERGMPIEFGVSRVIDGWTEGLQLMVEGEERRLWIPANLAYEGSPDRPQGMLVFDVLLIEIISP